MNRSIYCCGCEMFVQARLTDGKEIYPHRFDLGDLPFWKCDTCGNYVGCHHKTEDRTKPLGYIPTKELREARKLIHKVIDPLWKKGEYKRKEIYKDLTDRFGGTGGFHTANITSIEVARDIFNYILHKYRLESKVSWRIQ